MAVNSVKIENNAKKSGILKFLKGIKSEVKIITWASKKDAKKALVAVAVVTIIYVILVGGFDYIFQNFFEWILKLK